MRNIVAFPLLGLAVILQSSIVSQVGLLSGYADLILVMLAAWALQERVDSAWHWVFLASLMVGFVTRMPWPVVAFGYSMLVFAAQILQRRVWQAPLLAMFSVVFFGTLIMNLASFAYLRLAGTPLALGEVLGVITLPSLLLNMLIAIPIHALIRDLARWVYPAEVIE
jgi:hypothetical protein